MINMSAPAGKIIAALVCLSASHVLATDFYAYHTKLDYTQPPSSSDQTG